MHSAGGDAEKGRARYRRAAAAASPVVDSSSDEVRNNE
jgi:hypothetical protein